MLLVWSFPANLTQAKLPGAASAAAAEAAHAEMGVAPVPRPREGDPAQRAAHPTHNVHFGSALSEAQLSRLLPPSPSVRYTVHYRRCEVIQRCFNLLVTCVNI